MSLLQDEFSNSQQEFPSVTDDDTTSVVLETFEISSSNSLPTSSDMPAEVSINDESTSSDTIKLVNDSDLTAGNDIFHESAEVFVINDDDDLNREKTNKHLAEFKTVQMHLNANNIDNQTKRVILTKNNKDIFLKTSVYENELHSQNSILNNRIGLNQKSATLETFHDDEVLVIEDSEGVISLDLYENEPEVQICSNDFEKSLLTLKSNMPTVDKIDLKMQHKPISTQTKLNTSFLLSHKSCSTSQGLKTPFIADIESMDLLERHDFETEQKLSGGIVLKTSSIVDSNLNLNLVKSGNQFPRVINDNYPIAHNIHQGLNRAISSDSKCIIQDLPSTTNGCNNNNSLKKSTAKINLCSSFSNPQTTILCSNPSNKQTSNLKSGPSYHCLKSVSLPSSPLISSVIADTTTSTANSVKIVEACTNLNVSDTNSKPQLSTNASTHQNSCSRTSAVVYQDTKNSFELFDDVQPSTSSARCQYAPHLRQVHASAQTSERILLCNKKSASMTRSISIVESLSADNNTVDLINITERQSQCTSEVSSASAKINNSKHMVASFKTTTAGNESNITDGSDFSDDNWVNCELKNSEMEEICTCNHSNNSNSSYYGDSYPSIDEIEELEFISGTSDASYCYFGGGTKTANYSNHIQILSFSEEPSINMSASDNLPSTTTTHQRKRKYADQHIFSRKCNVAPISKGGLDITTSRENICNFDEAKNCKRIAFDYASTPCTSHNKLSSTSSTFIGVNTSSLTLLPINTAPSAKKTSRLIIPTRDNPPPELQKWLLQFHCWSHAERLLAIDRLIEYCEPTQVRHMMKVIEPQFQRDFISLLPRELALQVLAYLEPKDLLRAAQTCRSWRFLCDDNLLWKEKCRKTDILAEPRSDRPKRGRTGNMPPIASPWKAAYMRQHIIEMNWRSRPIRESKVLKGHDDHVITCLQFSGNRIVSGSDDNTLKVWSAITGRCLRTLVGHTGGVWSSQMSGNIIISGSTDRTLKVWDMETGQCVHTLMGHTSTVRCMHLHGNKVVSGSRDATLRVWDIERGNCLHVLVGHLAAVRCVQYDGKLIVSGAYDYMVKVWNPERQECLHTLQGHTNRVYSLQFDGMYVVSGSLDTSIRVWDVETGNCKHTLMGHQSLTSGMELRQNILVSGNADSTVKVWDITTGQCLQTLSGPNKHQSAVTCLQFNSRFVVTSSDDGTVKLWDVRTGEFIRNLVALNSGGSGGVVWRIRANDTKLICAVGSRNGTEETKLMVLDFDVEGACVKCS